MIHIVILQLALTGLVTDGTIERMVDEQELELGTLIPAVLAASITLEPAGTLTCLPSMVRVTSLSFSPTKSSVIDPTHRR
jgi:hypothetical protein